MYRLIACVLLLVSCGCGDSIPAVEVQSAYRRAEVMAVVNRHLAGMDQHEGTIVFNDGNPAYPRNQGNGNLFHGLLCYAGHEASCTLALSFRCDGGHVKRAPWRACGDESRDEYIGQAFVALKTKSVFSLPGSYPFLVTPTWARTMQLAGFGIKGVPDHASLLVQAKSVPVNYELHLVALQAWIRRIKGEDTKALDLVFVELRSRHPKNLFYKWLRADGATKDIVNEYLAWAPVVPVAKQAQWSWQDPPASYGNGKVHSAAVAFLGLLIAR